MCFSKMVFYKKKKKSQSSQSKYHLKSGKNAPKQHSVNMQSIYSSFAKDEQSNLSFETITSLGVSGFWTILSAASSTVI